MGIASDHITAGQYKKADIKLKGFGNKPFVVQHGLLGKTTIPIDKKTVKGIGNVQQLSHVEHQIEIEWSNGSKSLAVVTSTTLQYINAALF